MIDSNKLRPGMTFMYNDDPNVVLDASHNKTARSAAVIKIKVKNMLTGAITSTTFRSGESFKPAIIDKADMMYSYDSGDNLVFMDNSTYEQIEINKSQIKYEMNFLKEEMNVKVRSWEGKMLDIELPTSVELKVIKADPAVKGNTVQAGTKRATLETGYELDVPMFIEEGEVLEISTNTGEYKGRGKK